MKKLLGEPFAPSRTHFDSAVEKRMSVTKPVQEASVAMIRNKRIDTHELILGHLFVC